MPYKRLATKLPHCGIRGQLLQWIFSFLENRSQQVLVEGQSSPTASVTSGVQQGTVLGPLLFLAYINDLPSHVPPTCRLFADDGLLYRIIRSPEDQEKVQEDLDRLQDWERDWLTAFNPTKCKVIRFTKKRKPIHSNYRIHGHTLKVCQIGKILRGDAFRKVIMEPTYWCRGQESEQQPSISQAEYVELPKNHQGTVLWDPCQAHIWICFLSLGPIYAEDH